MGKHPKSSPCPASNAGQGTFISALCFCRQGLLDGTLHYKIVDKSHYLAYTVITCIKLRIAAEGVLMEDKQALIDQIRAFNRFYTVLLGFLNRDYLDSGYSVTEARILFELKRTPQISANRLIDMLHLDKSYISRLLRGLEEKGMLSRQISPEDGRARMMRLTPEGLAETDCLIELTNRKIYELIAPLNAEACDELGSAMDTIIKSFAQVTL